MKKLFLLIALICPLVCTAGDDDMCRHRLTLDGSISTEDSYDYGVGYHYMFCDYIGVGAHFGVWSYFPDGGIIGETSEERDSRENIFFRPSVLLMSPELFTIGNCTFHLECEPSLMISARQHTTAFSDESNSYHDYRTDCLSWRCDAGLGVQYRNVTFMAGCALSNLDIKREYKDAGSYSKKLVSSFGVKIGVCF